MEPDRDLESLAVAVFARSGADRLDAGVEAVGSSIRHAVSEVGPQSSFVALLKSFA
jgi:hypothetical protein